MQRPVALAVLLSSGLWLGCAAPRAQVHDATMKEAEPPAVVASAQVEEVHTPPKLSLPRAKNVVGLSGGGPVVTVTLEEVLLDGQRVADTRALATAQRVQRMEALISALQARKAQAGDGPVGPVQIRADEAVTFWVMVPLLFSCAQAGYPDYELVVLDEGGRDARVNVAHVPPADPRTTQATEIKVVVAVEEDGYVISTTAGDRVEIPARDGSLDSDALARTLAERRTLEPTRRRVTLSGKRGVAHREMVAALDRLAEHGFDRVPLVGGIDALRGSLAKEDIRKVIRSNINDVRYCYEKDMDDTGRVYDGRVSVRFIIQPDGSVDPAAVAKDTTGSDTVGQCIAKAVKTWRFPEPEGGGIVVVTYPFVLQTTGPGAASGEGGSEPKQPAGGPPRGPLH